MSESVRHKTVEKFAINTGLFRFRRVGFALQCECVGQYKDPASHNSIIEDVKASIKPSANGEWMKAEDAEKIYQEGFKDGLQHVIKNIVGDTNK